MFRLLTRSTTRQSQISAILPRTSTVRWISSKKARLILEDGSEITGTRFGYTGREPISGELVFNTGLTGYNETLSDPSYKGQILVLTYPLIGNYGSPNNSFDEFGLRRYFESDFGPQVSGVVVSEYCSQYSHWQATRSLSEWLAEYNVPAIEGVDTRALTKNIREQGTMLSKLIDEHGNPSDIQFLDINKINLVDQVSRKQLAVYEPVVARPDVHILVVDCGMKNSILRNLLKRNAKVTVVPWDHNFVDMFLSNPGKYDGLFISNGPGDPVLCNRTVEHLRSFICHPDLEKVPVFGICLGHQLLSTAAGGQTFKLPYGHRSQNQPAQAINAFNNRCFITSQNHGYAADVSKLNRDFWRPLFTNTNDGTNEGIVHATRPIFSVQFHPEAKCGPTDTEFLFDEFLDLARGKKPHILDEPVLTTDPESWHIGQHLANGGSIAPRITDWGSSAGELTSISPLKKYKKVLVLGSGGLQIGQAGEFDYSGSQALKALKEEGVRTILINPNIATVQTATPISASSNAELADDMYFLPVTPEFVEAIIRRERPDGIMLQFGGQTALNCGVTLHDSGVLEKYGVDVLGTQVSTIVATEDREIFAEKLKEIGETLAPSVAATTIEDAVAAGEKIGFPVIVRAAFSLGGLGSGFAHNKAELKDLVSRALAATPQVLVEKSLKGWKELEYEIVRDKYDNTIAVCNMENFDPLGIHTGDSIVIAPSQTLNDVEYHMLREAAIKIVKHVGVIGECNVQFALDPNSTDYIIIEMNPRLSRSSALASKATGYPLAFVAAKLALGKSLVEVENAITKQTKACFEPSLDYVVTKVPRWDLGKFDNVSNLLGSGMKSVGEVMSIGRNMEESLQKALRMVFSDGKKVSGLTPEFFLSNDDSAIENELRKPTDKRIFAIAKAVQMGWSLEKIHELTKIDMWFLNKIKNIIDVENSLESATSIDPDLLRLAKKKGFSDARIAAKLQGSFMEDDVRTARKKYDIVPYFKQIDTLAAEFPAQTNYLYSSYDGVEHDLKVNPHDPNHFLVLGGGGYRIGSSVEFDFGSVRCIQTLRDIGKKTSMINFNPETVSTDYDESDQLFFEELSTERVLDVHDVIKPAGGTFISFGGQIPNNLATSLSSRNVKLLGTSSNSIDNAEDRKRFSDLLDSIGVSQPEWASFNSLDGALAFAENVGYPVLVRPSYVLSGAGMEIVYDEKHMRDYLSRHSISDSSVVVSKFMVNWYEVDLDGVAKNGQLIANCVSEHVERAGVHSGDASLVFPSHSLSNHVHKLVVEIGEKMAKALNITGPFNSQLLIPSDIDHSDITAKDIQVIECNVRASRSLPFVAKTLGKDLAELATLAMIDADAKDMHCKMYEKPELGFYGVKVPQFSFTRLLGADPVLGVEMASTGEVACFGKTVEEAFLKGLLAANMKLPSKTGRIIISTGSEANKDAMIPYVKKLKDMGYEVYGTPGTAYHFSRHGVDVEVCYWDLGGEDQGMHPKASSLLQNKDVDLVINVPSTDKSDRKDEITNCFLVRRAAVDFSVPLITNLKVAQMFIDSLDKLHTVNAEKYFDLLQLKESINPNTY